jgi:hypothetical protein
VGSVFRKAGLKKGLEEIRSLKGAYGEISLGQGRNIMS